MSTNSPYETIMVHLRGVISDVSGVAPSDLQPEVSLLELGLDSLMFVRIGRIIEKQYGVHIAMKAFYDDLHIIGPLCRFLTEHGALPVETEAKSPVGLSAVAEESVARVQNTPPLQPSVPLSADAEGLHAVMEAHMQLMERYLGAGGASVSAVRELDKAMPLGALPASRADLAADALGARSRFVGVELERHPLTDTQLAFVEDLVARITRMAGKSKAHTGQYRPVLSDWKHSLQFRRSLKEAKFSLVTDQAHGAYIWDLDGNRYIDFTMGMGVSLFGHAPAFVQEALHAQLDRSVALGPQTPLAGEVAARIQQITGMDRVSLSITGSCAVLLALRIARAARKRAGIVKFGGAYHGISSDVMAIAGENGPVSASVGIPDAYISDTAILDYGSDDALTYIRTHADALAAVVVEPVQSRRPGFQPQRFLRRLRQVTRETGVILISDEMINGFRIAPDGAQGWFGYKADLVTYGKIVGGGLPMSVIAGRKDLLDLLDGGDWKYGDDSVPSTETVFSGGTHNRHPLALAGARAVLDHIMADGGVLYADLNKRTDRMVRRLNAIFERLEAPVRCTSFGSQFRFECVQYPFEMEVFFLLLQEQGIYTWEQHICCLSTAHRDEDIDALIRAVESAVLALREGGFAFHASGMPRRIYPMSSVQQRLYALTQREGAELPYHLSGVWEIKGALDRAQLELCLHDVICRHESLRTAFVVLENQPVQYIVDEPRFFLEDVAVNGQAPEELLQAFIRPFDLEEPPLLRAGLAEVVPGHYYLLLDVHHLAADGLSMNIVLTETFALYNGQSLPMVARQCRDTQAALSDLLASGALEPERMYWQEQLADASSEAELPLDYARPPRFDFQGQRITVQLEPEHTRALRQVAREQKISLFMVLLGAFALVLRQVTGRNDLLIGLPVAGRPGEDNDRVVGMFVNTVVLRLQAEHNQSLQTFLHYVRDTCLDAYSHQDYPFEYVIKDLGIKTRPDRNPLFDVMFSYERADERRLHADGLEIVSVTQYEGAGMFDFNIDIIEEQDVLHINGAFATSLFKESTVTRWMEGYRRLLATLLEHTDAPVQDFGLMSEAELQQIRAFNAPTWDPRSAGQETLMQMWDAQVAATPQSGAVCDQDGVSWSYQEVAQRVGCIAGYLQQSCGVTHGSRVAVCLETEPELVVWMLGIMKCGAAYVPIALDTPARRVERMLEVCHACVLVSTRTDLEVSIPVVLPALAGEADQAPPCTVRPDDVAYVIFTSGSTGTPKGVGVPHAGIARALRWRMQAYDFTAADVTVQMPACSFDASIIDMFSSLLSGGKLVMLPGTARKNLISLEQAVARNGATNLLLTPSLYRLCLEQIPDALAGLRFVTLAGEKLPLELAQAHYARFPGTDLWNEYGPTENSVVATAGMVRRDAQEMTIGRPVSHVDVFILDGDGGICPIGVWGEIWLTGGGLACGYEGEAELTAQAFLDLPGNPGVRAYRTGDIGRWLDNGEIAFRGRLDGQVKLHGYRIELDEIEQVLRGIAGIRDAAVDLVEPETGAAFLAAWLVLSDAEMPSADSLRQALAQHLPNWMIPSSFSSLEKIPLNRNGKVDRGKLPAASRTDAGMSCDRHVAVDAESPAAVVLLETCRVVLANPRLTLQDHYFAAGGDSISGILLISRLQEKGWRLEMDALFHSPLLADLAGQVQPLAEGVLPKVDVDGMYPTPMQARFIAQPAFVQSILPFSFWLSVDTRISFAVVQRVAQHWVTAHPGLLQGLAETQSGGLQMVDLAPGQALVCSEESFEDLAALATFCDAAQLGLNVCKGPLLQVVLCRIGETDTRILVAAHHFVFDGVSVRILLREWNTLLAAHLAGDPLPALSEPVSLRQWAAALCGADARQKLLREREYWEAAVAGMVTDWPAPSAARADLRVEQRIVIPPAVAGPLFGDAHRACNTHGAELLLVAFLRALGRCCGRAELTLEMESHGRGGYPVAADLSSTPGWCTAAYPVTLSCGQEDSIQDAILGIKDTLRAVPGQGVGYGILRYLLKDAVLVDTFEPRIAFNHMGRMDAGATDTVLRLHPDRVVAPAGRIHPGFLPALECFSLETDEGLEVTLVADGSVFKADSVQALLGVIRAEAEAIVFACHEQGAAVTSVGDFLYRGLDTAGYRNMLAKLGLGAERVEDVWPLTPMQAGLFLEAQREPDSEAYFEQMAFRLSGGVAADVLVRSLQMLVQRHPGLRALFCRGTGVADPVQIIVRQATLPVSISSLADETEAGQRAAIADFMAADRKRPFVLTEPPLMRVHIFDLGGGACHVVWSHHHLLMDGWCVGLLFEDWMQAYARCLGREIPEQPAAPLHPYFVWLAERDREKSAAFWQSELAGYDGPARLPVLQKEGQTEYQTETEGFVLSPETLAQIQKWVSGRKATLSTFLRLIWGTLLSRYSHRTDVVFGSIASGRPPEVSRVEEMVGLFINAVPVRFRQDAATTAAFALDTLQEHANQARSHEYLSLGDIQEACGQRELFDHLVVLENYPMDAHLRQGNVSGDASRPALSQVTGYERTHYPFMLVAVPSDGLQICMTYDGNRYDGEQVKALGGHFRCLVDAVLQHPDTPLCQLNMLGTDERDWLFRSWNARSAAYPESATISSLFAATVASYPGRVAVCAGEQTLTYAELQQRVDAVTAALQQDARYQQGERVVLWLPRDERMVIAMLAVLQAGLAYVPLDPVYPPERIQSIIEDCEPLFVLSCREMPALSAPVVMLDDLPSTRDAVSTCVAKPDQCAYVIYTSGSTGVPKGCMITHRNVVRLMHNERHDFDFAPSDVWVCAHSFCFDFSVWEMYGALLYGGRLVIAPTETVRDTRQFLALLVKERITILNQTPAAFYQLAHEVERSSRDDLASHLRMVIFGGDRLEPSALSGWARRYPLDRVALINMYGITETTVHVSYYALGERDLENSQGVSRIGRPLPETEIWVLGPLGELLPPGIPGEMYVGGSGVSPGYLHRPELTQARFLPHPFGGAGMVYRSGDMGRVPPDGCLVYLGRNDHQVQVRGFRVETGEIEHRLLLLPGVRQAAVLPFEDDGTVGLVAYVVGTAEADNEALRSGLRDQLPDYMVPGVIICLDALPLTRNGKLDRQALPSPHVRSGSGDQDAGGAPPQTEMEQTLATVWSDVLGVDAISRMDHFFALGGQSLKAVKVATLVEERTGCSLSLADIFSWPVLADQAARLEAAKGESDDADLAALLADVPADDLAAALDALDTMESSV